MAWTLASMVLKHSGSFLKPTSVRTSDRLMSENGESAGGSESGGVMAPPAGEDANCNHPPTPPTFLRGHPDGPAVAEGPAASPRRVHFVLHDAVDDPKLHLREEGREEESVPDGHGDKRKAPPLMFNHGIETRPTSFFTAKPTDTDTKGNLCRGSQDMRAPCRSPSPRVRILLSDSFRLIIPKERGQSEAEPN